MAFSVATGDNFIQRLQEQREREKREREEEKKKIKEENKVANEGIREKFLSTAAIAEAEEKFRQETVGLVTADEFRKKRKMVYDEAASDAAFGHSAPSDKSGNHKDEPEKKKKKIEKKKSLTITFSMRSFSDFLLFRSDFL
jgi:protein FAM50